MRNVFLELIRNVALNNFFVPSNGKQQSNVGNKDASSGCNNSSFSRCKSNQS